MTHAELTAIAAAIVGAAQRQLPPEIRPLARAVSVHFERTQRCGHNCVQLLD